MHDASISTQAFWETVADRVTAMVEPALGTGDRGRAQVVAYLRDLEELARRNCTSREAVQIIASGRRLLGDRSEVGPDDGPFAQT